MDSDGRRARRGCRARARLGLALLLGSATALLVAGCAAEEEAPPKPTRRAPRRIESPPELKLLRPDRPPTPLMPGFVVPMSREQAIATLGEGVEWKEAEPTIVEARGHCPGIEITRIEVPAWEHLGIGGDLLMSFYDGELYQMRFRPEDYMAYRERMEKEHGIAIRSAKRKLYPPGTTVWAPPIPPIRVLFEDVRVTLRYESVERACRYQRQQEELAEAEAGGEAAGS